MKVHTDGPLQHVGLAAKQPDERNGNLIFHCGLGIRQPVSRFTEEQAQNARRLVACWNACQGIKTEVLEKHPSDVCGAIRDQRDELLAALEEFAEVGRDLTALACHIGICSPQKCGRCSAILRARAAIGVTA